jgi:predicted nucleic acid-binding protein
MAEKYLIDTSAVIKYLNETFPAPGIAFLDKILNEESTISFIAEIELQVWSPSDPKDIRIYQSFVEQSTVLGLNQDIIRETIRIRRQDKLKLPDSLIAATAIVYDKTRVADNDKDFMRVSGLRYINPGRIHN